MSRVDLASIIADTQKVEAKNLSDFEDYMNQSTQMKKDLKAGSKKNNFVQQVINNSIAGKNSSESLPDSSNAQKIWDVLLSNTDYIAALGKLDLPQSMSVDDRLAALVAYMESQLQVISDA